jgi:ATPase subunit of ABC transporter with duplicated ATPase domains
MAGSITIGETVHLAYVDQSRDALDGNKTVWEEISGGNDIIKLGKHEMNSRAYCSTVQLQGRRPAAEGGHAVGRPAQPRASGQAAQAGRQRAAARRTDQRPRHRDAGCAEEALENFAGCAVVISHDRMFLDRLATHILAFEGDSHVEWFEGNFEDYEQTRSAGWARNPKRVTPLKR